MLSCATAIHLASQGHRALLVSTDPASNVAQVFGHDIGNSITPVRGVPGLDALEIDPQAAAEQYRERIVGSVRGTLPAGIISGIEEQLSGACTTEVAAFDEFTALLTDPTVTGNYEHIIFDTAPTGHTIRLLQLPGAWSGFIETNPEGASGLGPLAGPEHEAPKDPLANALRQRETRALASMPVELQALPTDRIELKSFALVGIAALSRLLEPVTQKSACFSISSFFDHIHNTSHGMLRRPIESAIPIRDTVALVDGSRLEPWADAATLPVVPRWSGT